MFLSVPAVAHCSIWPFHVIVYDPVELLRSVQRVHANTVFTSEAATAAGDVCAVTRQSGGRKCESELGRDDIWLPFDSAEGASAHTVAALIWMCKTRQHGSTTKQIGYGFKALRGMCCLLTFILCYYRSLSSGDNDNALGFKALRRAQHLRVLTFLVLKGWFGCSGSPLKLAQKHWKPKQAWLENHWRGSYLVCISHQETDAAPPHTHTPLI